MTRQCGECTLCCKLIPVPELSKLAGVRCQHQSRKGCAIYPRRPLSCAMWSCRWLLGDDTADQSRPDRSRCVIDMMPDFVTIEDKETGERKNVEAVQIWCDPKTPNAWRDEHLLDYIERRAAEGKLALIRFGSKEAITVFAPAMSHGQGWGYVRGERLGRGHTVAEIAQAIRT